MMQLRSDIVFDCILIRLSKTADQVVAAKRSGEISPNQVLQAFLDRIQALGRRHVRLGAHKELAYIFLSKSVFQDSDAVGFRGLL